MFIIDVILNNLKGCFAIYLRLYRKLFISSDFTTLGAVHIQTILRLNHCCSKRVFHGFSQS